MIDDDLAFQALMALAVELWGEEAMAEVAAVSLPTIRRWVAGASDPHPAMRRPLYLNLLRRVVRGQDLG
jgi:hypothetical protein